MEFPHCSSPNYHLYTFNQAGGSQSLTPVPPYPVVDLSGEHQQDSRTLVLPTVSVKVFNTLKKTDVKLFVLRNVNFHALDVPEKLRRLLVDQLPDEVSKEPNFDFGYFQGNTRIWVKSAEDLKDIQRLLRSKDRLLLWCTGKSLSKRQCSFENDSDSDDGEEEPSRRSKSKKKKRKSKYDEKLDRVEGLVDELKDKHSNAYTSMQYRVWAETIEAGRHDSVDLPPKGSFFKSQGRKAPLGPVANSSPSRSPASASNAALTPSKVASLRSTYIQQIKEMHSLMEVGAISNEHFISQRDVLLLQMDKLNQ